MTFELPQLPDHYYWDTDSFKSGLLYVRYTTASGIHTLDADNGTLDDNAVYDVSGRLVKRIATTDDIEKLPAGVYIHNGRKVVVK